MRALLIFCIAILITMYAVPFAAAQGNWDEAICNGTEGTVWRETNATTSDMPSNEGCDQDDELAWLVVEPWGPNGLNPDRACLAETWSEAYETATENEWVNGSAWRVSVDLQDNPLIVMCATVERDNQLGLNPGEGQIELREIDGTVAKAAILLGRHNMTMGDYAEEYPDDPISVLFNLFADYGIE